MKSVDLIFVQSDEWEFIYIDGVLYYDNYTSSRELFNIIQKYKHFSDVDRCYISSKWIQGNDEMPEKFSDIPEDQIRWI